MILVTGASGFIGQALCPALRDAGYVVRAQFRRSAAAKAHEIAGVEQIVTEALGPNTNWKSALQGCSVVMHLAGHAHGSHEEDPAACVSVNTAGTLRLAEQAASAGVQRLVFASTIKVNGEGSPNPYSEADTPEPQDIYAMSKWQAETGLYEISRRTGLEIVIVRFPLVYGPGVGGNFLRLMQIVDRGIPLPFAGVDNRRSLVYRGNLVSALMTCLGDAAANQTFVVADGEDVATPQLVRRLANALGKPCRMLPIPSFALRVLRVLLRGAKVQRLVGSLYVDDSKLRRELGWLPPYSMQQGLAATVAWFKASKS